MKFANSPVLFPKWRLFGLALLFALGGCSQGPDPNPSVPNDVVFEGAVKKGSSYQHELWNGLSFVLDDKGPWVIHMFHESLPDKDLVYPVNPPYRSEGHLMIGEGYGKSAKESIQDFPRIFSFLYRDRDISVAWEALNQILWPKAPKDQEKGKTQIALLPTGKGAMEVITVQYVPSPAGPGPDTISVIKFKVHLTWPKK